MQDVENIKMHWRDHQHYPATKADLVAVCNELSDFSEADKMEFGKKSKRVSIVP